MPPIFVTSATSPASIHLITADTWESAAKSLPDALLMFAEAQGFSGAAGQTVLMPDSDGQMETILFGLGDGKNALAVAALAAKLPEGDYKVSTAPKGWPVASTAAGWADGAYRFDRYLVKKAKPPRLVLDETDFHTAQREAESIFLLRDLVNTPADDMGPDCIQGANLRTC